MPSTLTPEEVRRKRIQCTRDLSVATKKLQAAEKILADIPEGGSPKFQELREECERDIAASKKKISEADQGIKDLHKECPHENSRVTEGVDRTTRVCSDCGMIEVKYH